MAERVQNPSVGQDFKLRAVTDHLVLFGIIFLSVAKPMFLCQAQPPKNRSLLIVCSNLLMQNQATHFAHLKAIARLCTKKDGMLLKSFRRHYLWVSFCRNSLSLFMQLKIVAFCFCSCFVIDRSKLPSSVSCNEEFDIAGFLCNRGITKGQNSLETKNSSPSVHE